MAMAQNNDAFEYRLGKISAIQTVEKMFTTIAKAQERAIELDGCIGFSVESDAVPNPNGAKEYLIHLKEGPVKIDEIGAGWHTYVLKVELIHFCITNSDSTD